MKHILLFAYDSRFFMRSSSRIRNSEILQKAPIWAKWNLKPPFKHFVRSFWNDDVIVGSQVTVKAAKATLKPVVACKLKLLHHLLFSGLFLAAAQNQGITLHWGTLESSRRSLWGKCGSRQSSAFSDRRMAARNAVARKTRQRSLKYKIAIPWDLNPHSTLTSPWSRITVLVKKWKIIIKKLTWQILGYNLTKANNIKKNNFLKNLKRGTRTVASKNVSSTISQNNKKLSS